MLLLYVHLKFCKVPNFLHVNHIRLQPFEVKDFDMINYMYVLRVRFTIVNITNT
jgi:hypothetical protein